MDKKKNGCLIAALCVVVFCAASCGTVALISGTMSGSDKDTHPAATAPLQTQTESLQADTETQQTQTEIPSRSLDDLDIHFVGEVPNDTTGNWRYSTMNGSDADFQEYAVSYYKKYMKENEVHAIINKECGHTIRINNWGDHALSVAFLEYHDGEENDASELFGGDLIDEYMITIETGEIEHIEQEEGSETEEKTIKDTEPTPKILHFILNTDTNCVHESERCSAAEAIDPVNRAEIDIPENELKNYQGVYWACGKCCSGGMKTMLPKPES